MRGRESPQAASSTARRRHLAGAALVVWSAAALVAYFGIYFWNAAVYWLKLPALLSGLVRRLSG